MILSFRTDRSGQTVQTQIRLLLEEQSDQGFHCLLFHRHLFAKYPKVCPLCWNFRLIDEKFFGIPKFRNFTVVCLIECCYGCHPVDNVVTIHGVTEVRYSLHMVH